MSTPESQHPADATAGHTDHAVSGAPVEPQGELFAVLAQFDTVGQVTAASTRVRDAGYKHWDVYSPFPIHGIDRSMGIVPTILPWIVLCGGLTGLAAGTFLVWYTNASDFPVIPSFIRGYQFMISGKPIFSLPANIPIMFETTVLLSAFGAVFGMLGLNKLPMLYNPLFKSYNFRRATDDRFFIAVEVTDPQFDRQRVRQLLEEIGGQNVEEVHD